jgi:Peptidase family M1 domain
MTRALLIAIALLLLGADVAAADPEVFSPAYALSLRATNGGFDWSGRESIAFTNPGATPLDRVWVRLWGNGAGGCRSPRAIRISDVRGARAGSPVVGCTAVALDLAGPVAPGARGSVSFRLAIRVPRRRDRFGRGGVGLALLSNALPALAVREAGAWRLEPYFNPGEAWVYPTADWRVRLRAPRGVDVAAPGVRVAGGVRRLANGRDYSFAAGRGLRRMRATVDGIRVSVWGPRNTRRARLDIALRRARRHLRSLARLYGPYGWPDLQIVLTRAAAMEHTALIMAPEQNFVLAHELAHMWWYASIGSDQARAPWLDEGFASYSEGVLTHTVPDCDAPSGSSRLLSRGVDYWDAHQPSYIVVYFEGACLLQLLDRRIGHARFSAALKAYAIAHRYGWHTAAAFMTAMNAAAGSPGALDDLWFDFGLSTR